MTQMTLSELTARAEITDVILLACQNIDRHRWDLMDEVFHDDATVKYSFRDNIQPYRDWAEHARKILSTFSRTLHQVGNMLINIEGDTAWCETYVTATHCIPPSAPKDGFWSSREESYNAIGGGRYLDRFEYRDGKWKISVRETIVEWRHDIPTEYGDLAPVEDNEPEQ